MTAWNKFHLVFILLGLFWLQHPPIGTYHIGEWQLLVIVLIYCVVFVATENKTK